MPIGKAPGDPATIADLRVTVERAVARRFSENVAAGTIFIPGGRVAAVLPSTGPADDKKAEIEAKLLQLEALGGGVLQFYEGDYYLSAPVSWRSKCGARGYGGRQWRVLPMSGWSSGGADEPTNAAIKAVASTSTSTTLSASAQKDVTKISLASVAGLTAGDYLQVFGTFGSAPTGNSNGDSDGASVTVYEIVRIASFSSNDANLSWPTSQFHNSGSTVRKITPVMDVRVEDIFVDASGGSVAVGLLARGVLGLEVRIAMVGASRAIVNLDQGTRDWTVDVHGAGEVNSLLLCHSAMSGRVFSASNLARGLRHHASGIPRGLICFKERCTDIVAGDLVLERGCVGLQIWGGKNLSFGDVLIRDMNTDRADTQWQTVGEGGGGGRIGAGLCGGAGPLGIESFAHGIKFGKVTLDNCRHPQQAAIGCGAYIHDWLDFYIAELSIKNYGKDATVAEDYAAGVVMADVQGKIDRLVVSGMHYGLRTENAYAAVDIDQYTYDGVPGSGTNGRIALELNHTTVGGPRVRRFSYANTSGAGIRYGVNYADPGVQMEWFNVDGVGEYARAMHAYNNTGTSFSVGDVVEFSGNFTFNGAVFPAVITPTGAGKRNCAVVVVGAPLDAGTGVIMVCPLQTALAQVTVKAADTVAVGELIESQNASREATKNNSSTAPLGKALSAKTGTGAPAKITIGPA